MASKDTLPATENRNHGKGILDSLPSGTQTHRYQGKRKLLDVVRRQEALLVNDRDGTQSQYLIVSHIDEHTLLSEILCENQDHLELDIIIHYFKEFSVMENTLLLKMGLSPVHESLHRNLYDIVRDKLDPMRLKQDVLSTGSTEITLRSRRKRPDTGMQPRRLPKNRNKGWPSLIMEVGYSRSRTKTDNDAKSWICQTDGKIKIGLAITANRHAPEFTIRKWVGEEGSNGIEARLDQEVKISKNKGSSQVRVTGGPFVIEFERLMLRAKDEEKSPQEVDIEIDDNDLEDWAEYAWEDQGF